MRAGLPCRRSRGSHGFRACLLQRLREGSAGTVADRVSVDSTLTLVGVAAGVLGQWRLERIPHHPRATVARMPIEQKATRPVIRFGSAGTTSRLPRWRAPSAPCRQWVTGYTL